MYKKIESCPVCDATSFKNELIIKDHSVSGESFAIVSCNNCNLWITSPRPEDDLLGRYYDSSQYISHTNDANNLTNWIYKSVRKITLHQKLKLIKSITPGNKILDYGCGTGHFLNVAKNKGYQIDGVEPNQKANEIASSLIGKEVYVGHEYIPKTEKYDIITLWHVLEHIPEPDQLLINLRKLVKKGGYIIIAVPNRNAFDAGQYREYWAAYDVPRHLYHFTEKDIKNLSKKIKLKFKASIPMKFDAYYVSMLSEKYLESKFAFIKGLKTGLISNLKASKNNEYSSKIYILKK